MPPATQPPDTTKKILDLINPPTTTPPVDTTQPTTPSVTISSPDVNTPTAPPDTTVTTPPDINAPVTTPTTRFTTSDQIGTPTIGSPDVGPPSIAGPTPPVSSTVPTAPDVPEITVTPPADTTTKDTTTPKTPPEETISKSPNVDIPIQFTPLFPQEKGTLSTGNLSKALGTDTLSSTLLGTALQAAPSSAEPYLLGTDEKARNVWNVESLRNALGI